LTVQFISQIPEFQLNNPDVYRNVIIKCAKSEQKSIKKITYNFVNEEDILKINRNFLDHDFVTDIITFDNSFLQVIEGEIFICINEVRRNAFIHSFGNIENELKRVVLHGLLHLIGYNDESDLEKEIMREKESFYMQYFN
jgi:rRNA maturation RNase YbeY